MRRLEWRGSNVVYRVRAKMATDESTALLESVDDIQGELLFVTGHHVVKTFWPRPKRGGPACLKYPALALAALIASQDRKVDALPLLFLSWRSRQLVFGDSRAREQLRGATFEVDIGAEMSLDLEWSEDLLTLVYARALIHSRRTSEAEEILSHLSKPELAILSYCEIYESRQEWGRLEEVTRAIGSLVPDLDPILLAFRANAFYHLGDTLSGLEAAGQIAVSAGRYARHKAAADYARLCDVSDEREEAEQSRAFIRFENPNCNHLKAESLQKQEEADDGGAPGDA